MSFGAIIPQECYVKFQGRWLVSNPRTVPTTTVIPWTAATLGRVIVLPEEAWNT